MTVSTGQKRPGSPGLVPLRDPACLDPRARSSRHRFRGPVMDREHHLQSACAPEPPYLKRANSGRLASHLRRAEQVVLSVRCGCRPAGPSARCGNPGQRPGLGPAGQRLVRAAAGPDPDRGIRPGTGGWFPGQKRAGVLRKLVSRVWASLHSATRAATRRPMRASGPPHVGVHCSSSFSGQLFAGHSLSLAVRLPLGHRRKALFCLLRYVLAGPETGLPGLSAPEPA